MAETKLALIDEIEAKRANAFGSRTLADVVFGASARWDRDYFVTLHENLPALIRAVRAAAEYREAEEALGALYASGRDPYEVDESASAQVLGWRAALDAALAALGGGETDG